MKPPALPSLPALPALPVLPDLADMPRIRLALPSDELPDPLADVETTGDLEFDAKVELEAARVALRAVDEQRERRMEFITDTEFWFAVCFQTRDQKEAFLKALGLFAHGDKYLDGYVVARKLKVELPSSDFEPVLPKQDRKLSDLT